MASGGWMKVRYVKDARTAHPTGDPNFAVKQCFPAAIPEEESDPFLMCDEFGPTLSKGAYGDDTDEGFDVAWHPHHGMDILSYIVEGRGRHADSMGNRETFDSPGFQWLSVGSGIEHAEGGGTPAGQPIHGFQIWLRMPTAKMEDDPRYGTVNPSEIPTVSLQKGFVRVIAGPLEKVVGPAKFAVNVQMLEVNLEPGEEWQYTVPDGMDNAMIYGFKGSVILSGQTEMKSQQICRFDTSGPKSAVLQAGAKGFRGLVFTGTMTKEKIIWHGPFVCSSRKNLEDCFRKYQTGDFPPKRVKWDYRDVRQKPK
eukprot:TRINITY_DN30512_c0_g1_i1.p1 TRINITY_DN30512_c0_g1~~TRINITY_DN30512_c0_g1_i1.p1  ORF type:complete len:310 (+),score=61.17 TRINITY_DN30512_c0_g1_i1:96-1025(+)